MLLFQTLIPKKYLRNRYLCIVVKKQHLFKGFRQRVLKMYLSNVTIAKSHLWIHKFRDMKPLESPRIMLEMCLDLVVQESSPSAETRKRLLVVNALYDDVPYRVYLVLGINKYILN